MTEIDLYIETIKAVNNEYQRVLLNLEKTLHDAYESGEIPLYGVDLKDILIIIHGTIMTAQRALKTRCDDLLEQIESEM